MQCTFTPILLGVGLAHLMHSEAPFRLLSRAIGSRFSPFIVATALFMLIEFSPTNIGGWPRLLIQFGMTMLVASCVIREDHAAKRALTWGPIRYIGIISYGMYLYHMWAIHLGREVLTRLHADDVLIYVLFPIASVLTIAISAISFRVIEAPILRFKRRFSRNNTEAR